MTTQKLAGWKTTSIYLKLILFLIQLELNCTIPINFIKQCFLLEAVNKFNYGSRPQKFLVEDNIKFFLSSFEFSLTIPINVRKQQF